MKSLKNLTKTQVIFYFLVFAFGFVYQPNWVRENFWLKAEFYDDIPFNVPYLAFLIIYSFLSTLLVWYLVKFAKKNL